MRLTPKEQEICNEYGSPDETGFVHCNDCPLNLATFWRISCYATIDERTEEAKNLRRY